MTRGFLVSGATAPPRPVGGLEHVAGLGGAVLTGGWTAGQGEPAKTSPSWEYTTLRQCAYSPARTGAVDGRHRRWMSGERGRSEALRHPTDHKACPVPKAPSVPRAVRFLPVRIVETAADREPDCPPPGSPSPIQILLDGGRRIAVGSGFDPDVLRRVVLALESPGC